MAVISARIIQPATSLTATAEMVSAPIGVRCMFSSIMILPRTGRAVMDIAAAMKSEKSIALPLKPSAGCMK
jgi:hypothetical protein